ncbi:PAS domain S-box protein [Anoxybacterium hadale]|uniref:PAS domain S-box protein n=1 Tax=Anoxybacterium hadale TaxID=3408580 RepID=A0ACD1AA83_9FIRM|nr:PAS domain S-box protein [Clostridiales bacterium]
MYLPSLIFTFIILTLLMSFVYFYMFARSQERYIRYWGLCWVAYSLSLLLLILSINKNIPELLEIRKIFDLANILFLLFGAYAFMHTQIPTYWYRFSLYLTMWLLLGVYYDFDHLSIYLPMSMYQTIVTAMISFIVYKYWSIPPFEKGLSISVFILWGAGKAVLSIFETFYQDLSTLYLTEIIFSNILNFSIFIIYLQKTKDEVKMADRLYRIIAENATDVIFYYALKPQPVFTYVSPSVETLTGYTPEEFYQNPRFYFEIVSPDHFDEVRSIFDGSLSPNRENIFLINHKNDSVFWGEFNISVIRKEGIPIAVEGIIRDVTRMKNAEIQLKSAKQSRDLLLSYISHELKTPITAILGYINALNDGTISDPDEKTSAMEIISSKALLLEHLIADLFQLSKLESNQFSFNFMHLSALDFSRQMIEQHLLDMKSAEIKPLIHTDIPALQGKNIIADPKRIDQVFSNIIYNAIKYTKPKDKIKITFGTDPFARNYIVTITDSGAGIPKEDLPYIFDRFFKAHTPTRSGIQLGSGLGLTISKEIINAHKGSISVKSHPGKGSTFTFSIPLYYD